MLIALEMVCEQCDAFAALSSDRAHYIAPIPGLYIMGTGTGEIVR